MSCADLQRNMTQCSNRMVNHELIHKLLTSNFSVDCCCYACLCFHLIWFAFLLSLLIFPLFHFILSFVGFVVGFVVGLVWLFVLFSSSSVFGFCSVFADISQVMLQSVLDYSQLRMAKRKRKQLKRKTKLREVPKFLECFNSNSVFYPLSFFVCNSFCLRLS